MEKTIAVIPGDGIGPDVITEAINVLNAVSQKYDHVFNYKNGKLSGNQNQYYPNGQLAEFFDSVNGKISLQKYVWFNSGKLKSALIYLVHKKNFYFTEFDQNGNIITQYETDVPF